MMLQLPSDLVQAVHDYLMTRPMREVEALVNEIRKAKPVEPKE
jgi:hypothetical protein